MEPNPPTTPPPVVTQPVVVPPVVAQPVVAQPVVAQPVVVPPVVAQPVVAKPPIEDKLFNELKQMIGEGDSITKNMVDNGVVVFGNTSSGKSTCILIVSGIPMISKLDDYGNHYIDYKNPEDNTGKIVLGHNMNSETKLPAFIKKNVGEIELTLWDAPGSNETRTDGQEIANAFYLTKIFKTNRKLKLMIVLNHSCIKDGNGSNFIIHIDEFIKNFCNPDQIGIFDTIKKSCILVVTKVPKNINTGLILNNMKRILDQNSLIQNPKYANAKSLIEHLSAEGLVSIFLEPESDGLEINSDGIVLEKLLRVGYVNGPEINLNISLGENIEKVTKLIDDSLKNLEKIVKLITDKCIPNPAECVNNDQKNPFVLNYQEEIQNKLPIQNPISYNHQNFAKSTYFPEIELTHDLLRLVSNIPNNMETLLEILKSFEKFSTNPQLKNYILGYIYVIQQQSEYLSSFSKIAKKEDTHHRVFEQVLGYKVILEKILKDQIIQLKIEVNKDQEYYKQAIKYLNTQSEEASCKNKISECYKLLGDLYAKSNETQNAIENYLNSLNFNLQSQDIYEKLGQIFFDNSQFEEAIVYFEIVNNYYSVILCFTNLITISPKCPQTRERFGDLYGSKGLYDYAKDEYLKAFSFANDEKKSALYTKIMNNDLNRVTSLTTKAAEIKDCIDKKVFNKYPNNITTLPKTFKK